MFHLTVCNGHRLAVQMSFCDFLPSMKSIAVATVPSGDRKCLLTSIPCKSDFHRSLRVLVESMSSESYSDTLIYENVAEIKQENRTMGQLKGMMHSSVNAEAKTNMLEYTSWAEVKSFSSLLQMKIYRAD